MSSKAIYPGTFDPITLGHINILEKASRLFDQVILAVASYTGKQNYLTLQERVALCAEATSHISNVEVRSFEGLAVDFARSLECGVMIRGLRAVSDFEYEFQMAGMNRSVYPEVETVFLTPGEQYMFISATMVREIARLGGDVSKFVQPCVNERLRAKTSVN